MNIQLSQLRCIHRHTIDEHPKCFAEGNIKFTFESDRQWEKITGKPWFTWPEYKIGYLDIEADGLKADFGTMLSWAIKDKGGDVFTDVVTKKELFNGDADKRIVKSLVDKLREYKIIVSYFGTGYDVPFARAKALHYGLDFPIYGERYHHDLFFTVKSKLCISRKSLEAACDYLGIVGKTPIDREVWRRAKYGDPDALDTVIEHNVGDVVILEELHDRLTPHARWTRRSI